LHKTESDTVDYIRHMKWPLVIGGQPSAFKRYGCWGRASGSAPAYPRGKQQMLPGYQKCSLLCTRRLVSVPIALVRRGRVVIETGFSQSGV